MIQQTYLNELASYTNTSVSKVTVNDSIIITVFNVKKVTANVFEIQYEVLQSQTPTITNIKIQKLDGTVISNNDVTIPINQTEVLIRQTITVMEVV